MLLYDWKKICKEAGNSSRRIILIIEHMVKASTPKNRYDVSYKYYEKDFTGHSFLINPEKLLRNLYKWKEKEIADYIGLASFRNLNDYKIFNKTTLDMSHNPLKMESINNNRLLSIENDNIHFLYEDQ